ncbi:hypothetical protein ACOSQ2_025244 [Xanthoceras sorbifolium]
MEFGVRTYLFVGVDNYTKYKLQTKLPLCRYKTHWYIVYMGENPGSGLSATSIHVGILEQIVGRPSSFFFYKRSFNGSAAKLTEEEMKKVEDMDGVVSVFSNRLNKLHTRRSWDFMGFPQQAKRVPPESDVIIGNGRTLVSPLTTSLVTSRSSNYLFTLFSCIRIQDTDYSPRDTDVHGSHTASTAAGGVPSATIAVYKVCWYFGCYDSDILAGFDDSIAGVDITINISGRFVCSAIFWRSPLRLERFMQCRKRFLLQHLLEILVQGVAVNIFNLENKMYPLVYGGDVPNTRKGFQPSYSRFCRLNSVNGTLVKGKIVFCVKLNDGSGPFFANATGIIMQGVYSDYALTYPLPATYVGTPTATISKSEEGKDSFAPYVVSFSSRGPNPTTTDILKLMSNHDPTWSPAAIKSAVMTTANVMSSENNTEAEFAYGQVTIVVALQLLMELYGILTILHLLLASTYEASVIASPEIKINVVPSVLPFKFKGEKLSFVVKVGGMTNRTLVSSSLEWKDRVHQVRSPIIVF